MYSKLKLELETNNVLIFAGVPRSIGMDATGPSAVLVAPTTGSLSFDTQTGNFTIGQVVTGGTSGATGTIAAQIDNGTSGILALTGISGTFSTSAEALTDPITGSAMSVAAGAPAGFLADGSACAYRQTWCKKDQEGIVMEGAPSSRFVVYNLTGTTGWATGKARNTTLRVLLPKENGTSAAALTTSYFLRIYRSEIEVALATPPSDEMTLVYEAYLTAGNISAGYVDVVDATTESFRLATVNQSPLYTNKLIGGDVGPQAPDGTFITGILLANDPPPAAADCVQFAECGFYANITYRDFFELSLLSVVAGTGLTAGDTITVTPQSPYTTFVMTAIAPGAPSNNQFVVYTSGTTTENIERTALNLVEAINKSSTNDSVWASYTPSTSFFGRVKLEARVGGGLTFAVIASAHGAAYRPQLTAAQTATADRYANGIAYSKTVRPDAVPRVNFLPVGRQDTVIWKMMVLRDSIYIFTDAGLYRLTGATQDNFAIAEFDLGFRLIGAELVTACDDMLYAWGVEGLAKISSSGVEYISNPIEPLIWSEITTVTLAQLSSYGWACAYKSRHKVVFMSPGSSSAKNCVKAFVYDTRMQAWTTWVWTGANDGDRTTGYACGAVRVSDDLLFMGQWNASANDTKIYKERRTYAATDYQDDVYDSTGVAIPKTLTWSAANDSPVLESHWDELHILYDVSSTFTAWTTPTAVSATFVADFASSSGTLAYVPTALSKISRISVPRGQRRTNRLAITVIHQVAGEYFGVEGMALTKALSEGTATVRT